MSKEKMKKKKNDFLAPFQKLMEEQGRVVDQTKQEFYPDGILADFLFSGDGVPELLKKSQEELSQEELRDIVLSVRKNICYGSQGEGDFEVRLDRGVLLSNKMKYELGKTVIKICVWDTTVAPYYVYLGENETLEARIFVRKKEAIGVLAVKNAEGEDHFVRLRECYLLSLSPHNTPGKEVGLLANYSWFWGTASFSIVYSFNLFPIKVLLLDDWIKTQWKHPLEKDSEVPEEKTEKEDVKGGKEAKNGGTPAKDGI